MLNMEIVQSYFAAPIADYLDPANQQLVPRTTLNMHDHYENTQNRMENELFTLGSRLSVQQKKLLMDDVKMSIQEKTDADMILRNIHVQMDHMNAENQKEYVIERERYRNNSTRLALGFPIFSFIIIVLRYCCKKSPEPDTKNETLYPAETATV